MRKIAVVTGTRAEYDILYSMLKAIDEHPALELKLIVTGIHLSPLYGYTCDLIEKDGFRIEEKIESLLNADTASARIKSAGIQLVGLVQAFERIKPDIVVATADREESITTALAGAYMNTPVAHICGGDRVVGNIDDSVRHAVTKLAHLHFPTTQENGERITKMGEEPWRVHVVGDPGIDRIFMIDCFSREELSRRLDFDLTPPLLLLIQHSISTQIEQSGEQMRITMESIAELGLQTVVIYPNSDAGSQQIIDVINEYVPRYPFMKAFENLPRREFVSLLRLADVLVGNSSCGILEAPSIKLSVVNIGRRQMKRQHAENVLYVSHNKEKITNAVKKALYDEEFKETVQNCTNPYGDGKTGPRIARILAEVEINDRLIAKDITY